MNESKKRDPRFWARWHAAGSVQNCSRGWATDGPVPVPCDIEVFKNGEPVALLSGRSNALERWVQAVAKRAKASVDWHYSGGIGQMLHLGDDASRMRVEQAIDKLASQLDGKILRRCAMGDSGIYRQGVHELPAEVVAIDTATAAVSG